MIDVMSTIQPIVDKMWIFVALLATAGSIAVWRRDADILRFGAIAAFAVFAYLITP